MTITAFVMALDVAACFSVFTTDLEVGIKIAVISLIVLCHILFFYLWGWKPESKIIEIGAKVLLIALSVTAIILSGWNWTLLIPLIISSLFRVYYGLTAT